MRLNCNAYFLSYVFLCLNDNKHLQMPTSLYVSVFVSNNFCVRYYMFMSISVRDMTFMFV